MFLCLGLEGQVLVKQTNSTFQVRLSDLSLDDRMDNTLHSRVIIIFLDIDSTLH